MTVSGLIVDAPTMQPAGASAALCGRTASQCGGQSVSETDPVQTQQAAFQTLLEAVLDYANQQSPGSAQLPLSKGATEDVESADADSDTDSDDSTANADQGLIASMFYLTVPDPTVQPEPLDGAEAGLGMDEDVFPGGGTRTNGLSELSQASSSAAEGFVVKPSAQPTTTPIAESTDSRTEPSLQPQASFEFASLPLSDAAESGESATLSAPTLTQDTAANVTDENPVVNTKGQTPVASTSESVALATAIDKELKGPVVTAVSSETQLSGGGSVRDALPETDAVHVTRRGAKQQTATPEEQSAQSDDTGMAETVTVIAGQQDSNFETVPAAHEAIQIDSPVATTPECVSSTTERTAETSPGAARQVHEVMAENMGTAGVEISQGTAGSTPAFSVRIVERPESTNVSSRQATTGSTPIEAKAESVLVPDGETSAGSDSESSEGKPSTQVRSAFDPRMRPDRAETKTTTEEVQVSQAAKGAVENAAVRETVPNSSGISTPAVHSGSSQASSTTPNSVAKVLEATEQDAPQPKGTAVREFSIHVNEFSGQRVALRVAQQGGEVHVDVRTGAEALTSDLRQNLPNLVRSLSNRGYDAEAWWSGTAESATRTTVETNHTADSGSDKNTGDGRSSGWSGGEQNGGKQGKQDEQRWREALSSGMQGAQGEARSE